MRVYPNTWRLNSQEQYNEGSIMGRSGWDQVESMERAMLDWKYKTARIQGHGRLSIRSL
jgi:hypothetical protein